MSTLEFYDLDDVFEEIWSTGYERYWFRRAWLVLAERKLTEYDTDEESIRVLLRAMCVSILYREFSHIAMGESCGYYHIEEWLNDHAYENKFFFLLGQIYRGIDGVADVEEDLEAASIMLVNSERDTVVQALTSEWGAEYLACSLYSTLEIDSYLNENADPDADELPFIGSYEDFWAAIDQYWDDIADSGDVDLMPAYEWIREGMHSLW